MNIKKIILILTLIFSSIAVAKQQSILIKRKAVLTYLKNLSSSRFHGVIAGQNCYHGNEIVRGFDTLIGDLHKKSGKWIGMLGVDYEFTKCFSFRELHAANQVLIKYWKRGALITINLTPHNPWINDESDLVNKQGTWDGPGSTKDKSKVTSLNDLIDPKKKVHRAWMRKLDRIAKALKELQDAGVIVLWRPLQEMNGSWFWWGMSSHPEDPKPYINLYRHMHNYFTKNKKLKNLLWVYSPNAGMGQTLSSHWNRPVDWAYPGDRYVDIIAGTAYNNNLDIEDYKIYTRFNKPLGIAEYGPDFNGKIHNGSEKLDTVLYLKRIKEDYPKIAYWVSWHWYQGANMGALVKNKNFKKLLNSKDIITLDKLNWEKQKKH